MAQLQRLVITASQLQEQQIYLTVQQQHYLSRVLRLQSGDRFIAMDGQGQWWLAHLEGEQARILEPMTVQTELPIPTTLLVALPKGNAFDEVVRQTSELGVSCLIPVISDRTLLHPSPQKLERWRRIAQEAAEQSERQIVPEILDPLSFSTALSFVQGKSYICVTREDASHLLDCLLDTPHSAVIIATGPEGGWTDREVEGAIAAGYQPVSLGRRILRAVTAPVVALSLVASALERRK